MSCTVHVDVDDDVAAQMATETENVVHSCAPHGAAVGCCSGQKQSVICGVVDNAVRSESANL